MGPERQALRNNTLPSISIESDTSLELTEELMAQTQEVESYDALLARAPVSNNTGEGVIIIHSDDDSLDGEALLTDSLEQPVEKGRGGAGGAGVEDVDGGKPTDSVSGTCCDCVLECRVTSESLECSKFWKRQL